MPGAAVTWLCEHVLLDILSETDTFQHLLRKIVVLSGMLFFAHPHFFFWYNLYRIMTDEGGSDISRYFFIAANFGTMSVWALSYLYARAVKHASVVLLDVWLAGTLFNITAVQFCSTYDNTIPLMCTALCAVLGNTPRSPVYIIGSVLGYFLYAYNLSAKAHPGTYTALIIGNPDDGGAVQKSVSSSAYVATTCVSAVAPKRHVGSENWEKPSPLTVTTVDPAPSMTSGETDLMPNVLTLVTDIENERCSTSHSSREASSTCIAWTMG